MSRNVTLINNAYPITYFEDNIVNQIPLNNPNQFWASTEDYAPATEYLIYDLANTRPVNSIDFEISYKPVDFEIFYQDDDDNFVPVIPRDNFQTSLAIYYLPALENSWAHFEYSFELVQTRYIKIVFTRRTDPFPLDTSTPFPFSIEIRNLRLMHVITEVDQFVPDSGVDILGNSYRTDLDVYYVDAVNDDDRSTFWQSQPNPSPTAVEAVYLDMRGGYILPDMGFYDNTDQEELDGRDMGQMELYYQDGTVIDEVYIDPITTGASMHIYYSLDDTSEWENKLWIPVNRHYILQKGYHSLPRSTYAKYLKVEFTNLTPAPYNIPEYPDLSPTVYRKYPTWVQNYFNNFYISRNSSASYLGLTDTIKIDPLTFGFTREIDLLDSGFVLRNPPKVEQTNEEIQEYITTLVGVQEIPTEPQAEIEDQIEFNSSFMWQYNLITQLDTTRALSRKAQEGEGNWSIEGSPIVLASPTVQSTSDLSVAAAEKQAPRLWFPIRCRHSYQLVQATRPSKVAYFVAIREIKVHRRDYTVQFDEQLYVETFGDTDHTELNDFIQEDWRFVVGP